MKQTRITDGLDRLQYRQQNASLTDFNVLENDWKVLFNRLMDMSRGIRFYTLRNRPDGYINELWYTQFLPILIEIGLFDIKNEEQLFIRNRGTLLLEPQVTALHNQLKEWQKRLTEYNRLRALARENSSLDAITGLVGQIMEKLEDCLSLAEIISNKSRQKVSGTEPAGNVSVESTKKRTFSSRLFYLFIMTIRKVKENADYYLTAIEHNGDLDPSLAIMFSFLKNYRKIVTDFNRRWEAIPSFYIHDILKSKQRPVRPDHTWLTLKKNPDPGVIVVPAQTGFIAGENEDGSKLYYRSANSLHVTNIELKHLLSIFKERDPLRYPAARMKENEGADDCYVTAIKQKELSFGTTDEPQELFGNKGGSSCFIPLGTMIESPMLLLREGRREGIVRFQLTPDSQTYMENMFDQAVSSQFNREAIEHKLLQDAFYLKISTTMGWCNVPGKLSYKQAESSLYLTFRLDEEVPSTVACSEELHQIQTEMPALQLVINRNAWLYPYSWATHIRFSRLVLKVEVQNLTSLNVYGETGAIDNSAPFYPFGVQAKKNSWMAFGNYEMSIKPLRNVKLACKWQQLPIDENGFAGHYKEYKHNIDNHSFRVRTEWLNNRKWTESGITSLLFNSSGIASRVKEESEFSFIQQGVVPANRQKEECYDYSVARNGFFRLLLENPEIGFGHTVYRELFSRIMMENGHLKKKHALPQEPVSPMMSEIRVSYMAEDEFISSSPAAQDIKIYHIIPLQEKQISPVKPATAIPLIQQIPGTANLMFGFDHTLDNDRIRFYVDSIPRIENNLPDEDDGGLPEISWHIFDGKNWAELSENRISMDTTERFTNSGLIEILLPEPVNSRHLDRQGLFWLWVSVTRNHTKCQLLRGIYMHAVEVIAEGGNGTPLPVGSITEPETTLPGILSIEQFLPGSGGRPSESETDRNIRITHRIAHRNRLITPIDYERMTLAEFPEIDKVKCLPGGMGISTPSAVTLIVMQKQPNDTLPMCSYHMLNDIRCYLQSFTPPTVKLAVINPIYEEVTVRCHFVLYPQAPLNDTVNRLTSKINNCIAPWKKTGQMPVFGYSLSLAGLLTILSNDQGIKEIKRLAVLYTTKNKSGGYELKEYKSETGDHELLPLSCPWAILVPSKEHLLSYLDPEETSPDQTGINELSIGNTFII